MIHREDVFVSTRGRSTTELTGAIAQVVARARVDVALCTVFVHHTSASLLVNENADPTVRADLERFFARLVRDGDPLFEHTLEGRDDMPAHVRTALTTTALSVPVVDGQLDLGTWQGVFLWEHRARPHRRRISVTVLA